MKVLLFVLATVFTSIACNFQVGDIVTLKCGGDKMVVIGIEDDCGVYVTFFGYQQGIYGIQRGVFPEVSVTLAPKEE